MRDNISLCFSVSPSHFNLNNGHAFIVREKREEPNGRYSKLAQFCIFSLFREVKHSIPMCSSEMSLGRPLRWREVSDVIAENTPWVHSASLERFFSFKFRRNGRLFSSDKMIKRPLQSSMQRSSSFGIKPTENVWENHNNFLSIISLGRNSTETLQSTFQDEIVVISCTQRFQEI